jgi:hypothetical protein
MSRSIPLYFAAAFRPRILQLGPSERTTIFWNCESQVKRAEKRDRHWLSYKKSREKLTPSVELLAASLGFDPSRRAGFR